MEIKNLKRTGNTVEFEAEAEAEVYKKALEEAYNDAAREIKIPGFRKGKAPRAILEASLNKEAVHERAARYTIANLYPEIIKKAEIEPIDYPQVNLMRAEENKPFVVQIKVEVTPEIKLPKYKDLKIKQKEIALEEIEIERVLQALREQQATFTEVKERESLDGDLVNLGLKAKIEGKEYKPLTRDNLGLLIGSNQLTPEFDQQLIGIKLGNTKKFEIVFTPDYANHEIAGKKVEFEIKLNRISEKILPPLDDEFAKRAEGGVLNLEDLNLKIRERLSDNKKQEAENNLRNELVEKVDREVKDIEIPSILIEREIDGLINNLKRTLEQRKLHLDQYLKNTNRDEKKLRDDLREQASKQVKSRLVLEAIAKAEKLEVTEIDLEVELQAISRETKRGTEEVKKSMGDGVIEYIRDYLLRRKAIDFLVANAKISYEK